MSAELGRQDDVERSTSKAIAAKSSENSEQNAGHEYEDVLQLIGFGRVQWLVLIAAGLLLMMVINETMGMSYITIVSQCDFEMNSMDKAIMSAASFIGIFCSSYFWGYLSDTVGRRPVLIYTTIAGNVLSLCSTVIPNYWLYVFLRFGVGFFIAGASSTTYAYLGEFFTPKHRPIAINYASLFVGISTVYVPATAWLILSMNWNVNITDDFSFRPWRLLTICYMLPGIIGTIMLWTLPESPKILMSLHKTDEAFAAVDWIAVKNSGKHLNEFKVQKLKTEASADGENILLVSKSAIATIKKMWKETLPLLKRPHLVNFVISCTIMCGLFFSSSGMGLWYPEIQNRLGMNQAEDSMTVCEVIDASIDQMEANAANKTCVDTINTKSYVDTITYGSALIVGYILMGLVLKAIGRKASIFIGLGLSGACAIILIFIKDEVAIVVCFCLYLVLPGLCVSIVSGAVVDLVPTHLRGKAVCICLMLGRTGSVFGSNIIGVLLDSYCSVTFGVFSGFVLVCAGLTLLLPI
ncbi:synaptic vesicle glycoprotein 2B isoform X1 [Drosophila serrata]|uniref:synaptic vesicle glycoprotein 2B isoform X1 n=2 Tax=Drosophila serrata TaxID=7274 RepID=UPI000A1D06CA|nr:synaptic vesicle glycoprotein 2B isoform X1 [Drosophila serrata]